MLALPVLAQVRAYATIGVVVVVVSLLAALAQQRASLAALRAESEAAVAETYRLRASVEAERANAARGAELLEAEIEAARLREPAVREVIRRVYVPRDPLPAECDRALDPVRDALDGVRDIRRTVAAGGVRADGATGGTPTLRP